MSVTLTQRAVRNERRCVSRVTFAGQLAAVASLLGFNAVAQAQTQTAAAEAAVSAPPTAQPAQPTAPQPEAAVATPLGVGAHSGSAPAGGPQPPVVAPGDVVPPEFVCSWQQWPERLRYVEGEPTPTGYVYAEEPVTKLWISGIGVAAAPYLIGLAAASVDNFRFSSGWLGVPVLGPWITLALRDDSRDENRSPATALVLDGVMQASGIAMIAIANVFPNRVLIRRDVASVGVSPIAVGERGYGVGAVGRF